MGERDKEGDEGKDQKNALEWAVFGVSLLLVAGVLGYWSFQVFNDGPSSPDLYVERRLDPAAGSPYRYRVAVHNKGGQTAESAMVEVALKRNGQELEKAHLQISFVPNGSKREGWVTFETDPAEADTVVARVVSYKKP